MRRPATFGIAALIGAGVIGGIVGGVVASDGGSSPASHKVALIQKTDATVPTGNTGAVTTTTAAPVTTTTFGAVTTTTLSPTEAATSANQSAQSAAQSASAAAQSATSAASAVQAPASTTTTTLPEPPNEPAFQCTKAGGTISTQPPAGWGWPASPGGYCYVNGTFVFPVA